MAGLLSMPTEILDRIARSVKELGTAQLYRGWVREPETLSALSQTSRALRTPAQRALFSSLTFRQGRKLKAAVEVFSANPRLGTAVRQVTFFDLHVDEKDPDRPYSDPVWDQDVAAFLRLTPSVVVAVIMLPGYHDRTGFVCEGIWKGLRTMRRLKTLVCANVHYSDLCRGIAGFPSDCSLGHVFFEFDTTGKDFLPGDGLPSPLDSLHTISLSNIPPFKRGFKWSPGLRFLELEAPETAHHISDPHFDELLACIEGFHFNGRPSANLRPMPMLKCFSTMAELLAEGPWLDRLKAVKSPVLDTVCNTFQYWHRIDLADAVSGAKQLCLRLRRVVICGDDQLGLNAALDRVKQSEPKLELIRCKDRPLLQRLVDDDLVLFSAARYL